LPILSIRCDEIVFRENVRIVGSAWVIVEALLSKLEDFLARGAGRSRVFRKISASRK
jgi:hypothetical protein